VGGVVSGIGAWFSGGNVACAGLGGCISGMITAAFPNAIGGCGCIGGVAGSLANAICSGQCINACSFFSVVASSLMGCLGGSAASSKDQVLEYVIGIAGFDMGLFMGMCGHL
jgi:hypothetical protein